MMINFRIIILIPLVLSLTSTTVTCSPLNLNVSRTPGNIEPTVSSTTVTLEQNSTVPKLADSGIPGQSDTVTPDAPVAAKAVSFDEGTRFGPLLMVTLDPVALVKPVESAAAENVTVAEPVSPLVKIEPAEVKSLVKIEPAAKIDSTSDNGKPESSIAPMNPTVTDGVTMDSLVSSATTSSTQKEEEENVKEMSKVEAGKPTIREDLVKLASDANAERNLDAKRNVDAKQVENSMKVKEERKEEVSSSPETNLPVASTSHSPVISSSSSSSSSEEESSTPSIPETSPSPPPPSSPSQPLLLSSSSILTPAHSLEGNPSSALALDTLSPQSVVQSASSSISHPSSTYATLDVEEERKEVITSPASVILGEKKEEEKEGKKEEKEEKQDEKKEEMKVKSKNDEDDTVTASSNQDSFSPSFFQSEKSEREEKKKIPEEKEEEISTLKFGHRRSKLDDSLNLDEDRHSKNEDLNPDKKSDSTIKPKVEETATEDTGNKNEETSPVNDGHESIKVSNEDENEKTESLVTNVSNQEPKVESNERADAAKVSKDESINESPVTEANLAKQEEALPTTPLFVPASESIDETVVPTNEFKLASPDAVRPPLSVGIVSTYNPSHGLDLDDGAEDAATTTTVPIVFVPAVAMNDNPVPKEEAVQPDKPVDGMDAESKDYDDHSAHDHSADSHANEHHSKDDRSKPGQTGHSDDQNVDSNNNHIASSSSTTTLAPEVSSWSHPSLKNMERKRKGKIDDGLYNFGRDRISDTADRTYDTSDMTRQRRPIPPPLSGNNLDNQDNLESLHLMEKDEESETDLEKLIKSKSYHLIPIFIPFLIIILIILASKSINKVLMMKRSFSVSSPVAKVVTTKHRGQDFNKGLQDSKTDLTSVVSLTPSDEIKSMALSDDKLSVTSSVETVTTNCSKL